MFKKIIHHPYLALFTGILLLLSAGYETWHSFEEAKMGAHHGVLFYSLVHIAKAFSEFKEGAKEIGEGLK